MTQQQRKNTHVHTHTHTKIWQFLQHVFKHKRDTKKILKVVVECGMKLLFVN